MCQTSDVVEHKFGGETIRGLTRKDTKALFSSQKILQNFLDSPSHQIFRHMHEALNIDKK
jgi:hypothetical protein